MRITDLFLIPPSSTANDLYSLAAIDHLSELLTEKNGKAFVQCQVRKKGVLAKPEEIVRQFWLYRLIHLYGYPVARLQVEYPITFGRDTSKHKWASVTPEDRVAFMLNSRDVLFNRTNSQKFVGHTGLYLPWNEDLRIFASYLVRLQTNELIEPEYLVAFLNSKLGQRDIKRRARISINQSNVNPEEVKAVRIPLLSKAIQTSITRYFETAHGLKKQAAAVIRKGESLLAQQLGFDVSKTPETLTSQRTLKQVNAVNRFDAQHFAPAADHLFQHLRQQGTCRTIAELTLSIQRGAQPVYSDTGAPVVNSQHVHSGEVHVDENNRIAVREGARVFIENGDVVINGTGVGTIGRAAPYVFDYPALPDNHVTVLKLKKGSIEPTYLATYLNSDAGQLQVEKWLSGSSGQNELYPKDIERFIVWIAPEGVQQSIRLSSEQARHMQERAAALLQRAKRAVDVAIEESEEAALAFLRSSGD